jgi:hypothetical protein
MSRRKSAPPPKSKAKATSRSKLTPATISAPAPPRQRLIIGAIGLALVIVIAGILIWNRFGSGQTTLPPDYQQGSVTNCNSTQPAFAQKLGFSTRAVLDTRSQDVKGIALFDLDQNGKPTRSFQDPTWVTAGFLGPPVLDGAGNIYVAPIPAINILDNPPAKANYIYRIDAATGKMTALLDLPSLAQPTPENPYGIMALFYDCDTNSLYASSVFGSTRFTQAGRLFRIDLNTNTIRSVLDGIDAFGLAVFNSAQGKRLYWGLARSAVIDSIPLDAQGDFSGSIRTEVQLLGLGFHGDERARDIRFSGTDKLLIKTIQFDFNLVASTETRQTAFEYHYDSAQDRWQFVSSTPFNS